MYYKEYSCVCDDIHIYHSTCSCCTPVFHNFLWSFYSFRVAEIYTIFFTSLLKARFNFVCIYIYIYIHIYIYIYRFMTMFTLFLIKKEKKDIYETSEFSFCIYKTDLLRTVEIADKNLCGIIWQKLVATL